MRRTMKWGQETLMVNKSIEEKRERKAVNFFAIVVCATCAQKITDKRNSGAVKSSKNPQSYAHIKWKWKWKCINAIGNNGIITVAVNQFSFIFYLFLLFVAQLSPNRLMGIAIAALLHTVQFNSKWFMLSGRFCFWCAFNTHTTLWGWESGSLKLC